MIAFTKYSKTGFYEIRGERVMPRHGTWLRLYEVPTKVLNQAVKTKYKAVSRGFLCFQLSISEWQGMRSQFVTTYPDKRF